MIYINSLTWRICTLDSCALLQYHLRTGALELVNEIQFGFFLEKNPSRKLIIIFQRSKSNFYWPWWSNYRISKLNRYSVTRNKNLYVEAMGRVSNWWRCFEWGLVWKVSTSRSCKLSNPIVDGGGVGLPARTGLLHEPALKGPIIPRNRAILQPLDVLPLQSKTWVWYLLKHVPITQKMVSYKTVFGCFALRRSVFVLRFILFTLEIQLSLAFAFFTFPSPSVEVAFPNIPTFRTMIPLIKTLNYYLLQ